MNKLNVLVFVGGIVTGILGTVLYMRNQYEIVETNEWDEKADKLVCRAPRGKKCEPVKVEEYKGDDEIAATVIPQVVINANKRKEIPREISDSKPTRLMRDDPDFHWHYDLKGTRSERFNAHPSELEAPHDGPDILIIPFEEFNDYQEATEYYDKLTISYYAGDDVLADENDQMMIEDRYVIGDEALSSFGKDSGDDMVVYVRNHPLTIDYEVVKIDAKYSELVLGQYEDDKEEVS